jgi:RimJ/RimL family protein N-acetyltransferase
MDLVTYSAADLELTEAIETDPEMMSELGGPIDAEAIPAIHRKRLNGVANGDWWFKIVPKPSAPAAGTIGIWPRSWNGAQIHEIGWMVLPAFQRRGVASAAVEMILSKARSEPRFRSIHAFPGASNGPSNGLCRKFGFTMVEPCDLEYAGRPLKCNHWELDLTP